MEQKEKNIQRALGTLPTFFVRIKVRLEETNRAEALAKSREMVRVLRREFPGCKFDKNIMRNMGESWID